MSSNGERLESLKDIIRDKSLPIEHRRQAQKEFNGLMTETSRATQTAPSPTTEASYRGQHEAPTFDPDGGTASMTDISALVPGFYERSHEYRSSHTDTESAAMDIMHQYRGRRKGAIRVYRAIPADVPVTRGKGIQKGDWVTPVRDYAVQHGKSHLGGQFKVVTKTVPPMHLYTDANSWEEWGYDPTER